MKNIIALVLAVLVTGCTSVPEGVKPVTGFELSRYLGKWYEVARLPHSFEEDLQQVTADYRLKDDGGVRVLNRGFNVQTEQWEQAEGKAYFVQSPDVGHLKVSFFGPFYGAYVIVELDKDHYRYALVSGPDREYLWILAREPQLDDGIKQSLVSKARQLGYATEQLIWVQHSNDATAAKTNP
ncbi:Putative lipocalin [Saliniradius amylolyticus]|uniref:Outer membrane lipoprotein Blc n=1 Tax=Saliniradius amylolyticus TaxID=2183582 RepID=A0A2S2E804_9ALTE|nr:lipocalin family protein [Saliniradius amylolyticus]AWL13077.1 Putative lipocalin [Saliniradius amylolyticus]